MKNIIPETVLDMQSHVALLAKNHFSAIFGGYLEFLHYKSKRIYLTNGARYSDYDENFGPQGIHSHPFKIAFSCHFFAGWLNFCINEKY